MEKQIEFELGFGALCPHIGVQLKEQKLKFTKSEINYFEKLRQCTLHLVFSDLINDKCKERAYKKLFSKVSKHVKSKNKTIIT